MRKFSIFNFQFSISGGFTLFELLLSISIMGILIGVIIFLIDPGFQFKKARDGQRKSDLRTIQSALELYRSDRGFYPNAAGGVLAPNCGGPPVQSFGDGDGTCATIYLQKVPIDPKTGGGYNYSPSGSPVNNRYDLIACLENTNDTQKDTSNTAPCDTVNNTNWAYTLKNP